MKSINLNQLDLNEFVGVTDPKQRCKATFPLFGSNGASKLAAVYVELEQGDFLGNHVDSAEELLIVLEGKVQISVGKDLTLAEAGHIVVVPEMMTHNIMNTGSSKARVLGVFGGVNQIVATFEQAWKPTFSNVVDTTKL